MDAQTQVVTTVADGFSERRAAQYATATQAAPLARKNELKAIRAVLDRLGLRGLDRVVELGIGQAFGTQTLLERLAPSGIIHGVDASPHMLSRGAEDPRIARHVGAIEQLRLPAGSVDFAFSLAAFHHVPNKWLTLLELRRVLRPGAGFLVVDVAHATPAQRVFDYIVRPHCSSGHDADFLDDAWATVLAERAELEFEPLGLHAMDWEFESEAQTVEYVKELFSLDATTEQVRAMLDHFLAPRANGERGWALPWSLGMFLFRKAR